MEIRPVKNEKELEKAYTFLNEQLYPSYERSKYTLEFLKNQYILNPQLLILALIKNEVTGCAFGWDDNGDVTLGALCVDINHRRKGTGIDLISKLEDNAKRSGFKRINLGSVDDAVDFYIKAGYEGIALVQSSENSIDELLSVCDGLSVIGGNIYDGCVNQIFIKIDLEQRDILREKFITAFPQSNVSIMLGKQL